jgi:hypothetical protein
MLRLFVSAASGRLPKSRLRLKGFGLKRGAIGWHRPIDKNSLQISKLEHVRMGKAEQFF